MTTYYISYEHGLDANNGLGPDASHGTNKPWKTWLKAHNTGSPVLPGDTVYLAPGFLYDSTVTPIASIASVASPTSFIGDPLNAQGFKSSGGVRVAPGPVWLTTRAVGEGQEGGFASTSLLINGSVNGTDGLTFRNLVLEATPGLSLVQLSFTTNTDWIFEDCLALAGTILTTSNTAPTAGRNWTFRRCETHGQQLLNLVVTVDAATADADINLLVEHCHVLGRLCGTGTALASASPGNLGGGVRFKYCTVMVSGSGQNMIGSTALRVSTVAPITVEGCLLWGGSISAGTAGQIIDNGYNRIVQSSTPTNFTPAGTTVTNPMMVLSRPSIAKWGLEMPRSDYMAYTPLAPTAQRDSGGTNTASDFSGRTVRPWGGGPSIGCFEFPEVSQDTGSQITGGGANSLKLVGAGEISLFIPVDAVATTLTVVTESTSYGGASYPQLIMGANPDLGLTQQTASAVSASEQTLTVGPFTPSAAGVVEIRLISRSTSLTSATYFDLLAAAVPA